MSFKKEWLDVTQRVITRNGLGKIVSLGPCGTAVLDEPVAGERVISIQEGDVVVESDFSLLRVISSGRVQLSNAQNFPSWEECSEGLAQPFSQDETLIALNFQTKKLEVNRFLQSPMSYHLIEAYMDMYWPMELEDNCYSDITEAKKAWERVERLSGTSDHILLCSLVNLHSYQILARALFATFKVIKKDTWW